ncbi:MAG: hypothetical protein IJU23_04630 [Proteobacteria bacterium]|nr:hypothetical protein [Pseudomonadota bacterium]
MSDNDKFRELSAEELSTAHIHSTHDDEVIQIGADLVPDDIDMYPRSLGTREMPFREVVADRFCGSLDPLEERDNIGAGKPFNSIRAKAIYGDFRGTIHGMGFPGNAAGYGWFLVLAENTPDGVIARVQRSFWPAMYFDVKMHKGGCPHILVHPNMPFLPFTPGSPVFVETIRLGLNTHEHISSFQSVVPVMDDALKTPQLDVEIDIPLQTSGQYHILCKLY